MNIAQAKKIQIADYLNKIGYVPHTKRDSYLMFLAEYRGDHDASLKVDLNLNIWYDFGTGRSGGIIDLAMQIYNTTDISVCLQNISNAIQFSEKPIFSFQKQKIQVETKSEIEITKVLPLEHPALLQYLQERCINVDVAKANCKQIHYNIKDKNYFAIGFQNNTGGWELRNKYFKGCSGKDITTADNGGDSCVLFEGFFDYLSYLTLRHDNVTSNVCVLNTVINLEKAKGFLKQHKTTSSFLDNDDAGRTAIAELQKDGINAIDESNKYSEYKDLNLYLCSLK
jgi:DNA primase